MALPVAQALTMAAVAFAAAGVGEAAEYSSS